MKAAAAVAVPASDDAELARRCARRDPAALRLVVTANNQRLFRAAWSILKDRGEAEEAVQSAYLKAFSKIGEFEGRSALSTWLTRITINEALGRLRSIRRRQKQLEDQGVSVLETYRETLMRGSQAAPPDARLAREQLRQLLEHAVAGLPDAFRSVFVLREIEGQRRGDGGGARPAPGDGQDPAAPRPAQAARSARAGGPFGHGRRIPVRRRRLRGDDRTSAECRPERIKYFPTRYPIWFKRCDSVKPVE